MVFLHAMPLRREDSVSCLTCCPACRRGGLEDLNAGTLSTHSALRHMACDTTFWKPFSGQRCIPRFEGVDGWSSRRAMPAEKLELRNWVHGRCAGGAFRNDDRLAAAVTSCRRVASPGPRAEGKINFCSGYCLHLVYGRERSILFHNLSSFLLLHLKIQTNCTLLHITHSFCTTFTTS